MTLWSLDSGLKRSRGHGGLRTDWKQTPIKTGQVRMLNTSYVPYPYQTAWRGGIVKSCHFANSSRVWMSWSTATPKTKNWRNPLSSNLVLRKLSYKTHTMIFELLMASIGLLLTTILMIAIILCMEQCRRRRETAVSGTLPINESNRQSLEPSQWVWSPFAPSAPHLSQCEEARVEPQPDVRRQTTLTSFTEHMWTTSEPLSPKTMRS